MKSMRLVLALASFLLGTITIANPLWLRYPAISPDGKQIAFAYKGDIYLVDANGGAAQPLTINPAHDYRPVWSEDGKSIAFASNRYGNFDVYVMPANGGEANRLTFHSTNEIPYRFSRDNQTVLFSARILDDVNNAQFPYGRFPELYSVSLEDLSVEQVLTTPAVEVFVSADGKSIYYQDIKGYEDEWRKHHTSAVTRDIWRFDSETNKHSKLSSFEGEDRNPVLSSDGKTMYFLSEQFGSFNVCKMNLEASSSVEQVSNFDQHPVRFLSISNSNKLCFSYNGELYTQTTGEEAKKVEIEINIDESQEPLKYVKMQKEASEMSLSPNGKELVFVAHGEVFVASTEFGITKRITNTTGQERSVSFSPDGRSLVYAGERDESWNIYTSSISNPDEAYFFNAASITEKPVLETDQETFQPYFSPDGKEVAFLENRVVLRVVNLASKDARTILSKDYNYSYSDGDQWYQWSPDGKWFLVSFHPKSWFVGEVGLVSSNGKGEVINLTKSGYGDDGAQWMLGGNAMIWYSQKNGLRSHGSWGAQSDVYAMFFNQQSFDAFNLSKEEKAILKEQKKKSKTKKEKVDLNIDLENVEDRIKRLTIHSSDLNGAHLTADADKLYYLSKFEKGFDLWVQDFIKNETKKLASLPGNGGYLQIDSAQKNIYVLSGGSILKVEVKDGKISPVPYQAEMYHDAYAERSAIFEHAWRQVKQKWYRADLHGVDWDFYKQEYARFLPHINNNFDFSEMLSELLGELNGSHTGCRYYASNPSGDETAALGLFYDNSYDGSGLKVVEVLDKSPVLKANTKITSGVIIEEIDGQEITASNRYSLLNHKAAKPSLLSVYDANSKKRWTETVRPITQGEESQLLYERWIKQRRAETEKLSGGRIGYVHVRGMNSESYREFYAEVLGRNHDKEAIIVDTRFNGGGWLHDDLVTFLSGKRYADYYPGGKYFGSEPIYKWTKPSSVLISEGNYSDAHAFPFAYNALEIGKLVGMPVPGTMTAVWWEQQIDPSLVFGIPQVGVKDMDGNFLENQQLEPDVKVENTFEALERGEDQQLAKAIEDMLQQLDAK